MVITAGEGALRIQAHRLRAECLMRRQKWAEARQDVDAVFAAGVPILNRDIKRRVAIYSHLGAYKQAAATIQAYTKHWLMENSQTRREGLTILTAAPPQKKRQHLVGGGVVCGRRRRLCARRSSGAVCC